MFGKKKVKKIKPNRVSTVVGQGTEVHGNIVFSGGLHIDGVIKGNVSAESGSGAILSLSELGRIEGEVHVPVIILNGTVKGNVFASDRVELAPKSRVTGNLTYNLIEMTVGAEVNGRLLHQDDTPVVKVAKKSDKSPSRPLPRPREAGAKGVSGGFVSES